ncbi:MAG TPA: 1-(5-phosphoribosyl)-5-[(5-phosphoribosylamino)methylideneamino]imidazole-4-carboxamide isomerase [Acidimicrobiia bacterium]|nr:1-(5-phosphoribosyl)-5-[(5-phosphoribosylamino)methylideneamino]imidazole-4-carboxamide isomerase [Acidimicrobiia bacterium]
MSCDLYPAIDIRDGRVVRLLRGDYSVQTVYDDDPVAVAKRFDAAGARWIHVVDLDAARDGGDTNLDVVGAICASVRANIQTGGGVRTVADAHARFTTGAARVVLGSAAVESPEIVDELAASHADRIAVGLDARGRAVAIHGWEQESGHDIVALARRFDRSGVGALIVTEIGRDGTLAGPDLEQIDAIVGAVGVPVIASGGVGTLDDLRALAARPVAGVIAGRAIYEGRFTVEEGVAACSQSA